jgi:hypothetical protein
MKRIELLASLTLFLALGWVRAEEKLVETPYHPLKVGTTWTYKVVNAPDSPSMVLKVARHEKVGDLLCARIETVVNGQAVANEYVTVTKDGIYRVSANGTRFEPPMLLLKLPPRKGDSWKVDARGGTEALTGNVRVTEEAVTVPMGKYDTFPATVTIQAGAQKMETANYYAKGVGIVRVKANLGPGLDVLMELEKFEEGK